MIKILLSEDKNVINCLNFVIRFFLYEVVYVNNYNILEILLKFGGDVNVYCDDKMLLMSVGFFIDGILFLICCLCGFIVLYIVVKYGYYSVVELFIKYGVDFDMLDCNGFMLFYIVFCYNMLFFVIFLVSSGVDMNV